MYINNERMFIFLHIPKTGGTFISHFLSEILNTYDNVFCLPPGKSKQSDWHTGVEAARELVSFPVDDYLKFTVVRNPFDWYVSLYEYTKKHKYHEWRLFSTHKNMRFKDWLRKLLLCEVDDTTIEMFRDDHSSTSTLYKHLKKSQLDCGWLTHRWIYTVCENWKEIFTGESLEEFEHNEDKLSKIDWVLKQENLNKDLFNLFSGKIGYDQQELNRLLNRPRVNRTKKKFLRRYYDRDCAKMVVRKERYIFNKFGYSASNSSIM